MTENKEQAEAIKLKEKKQKSKNKPKGEPKEMMVSMSEFADKVVQKALLEMRKDFSSLAYRVFATELSVYGLLNKGSIPKEFKLSVLRQEDILNANVESMLKRLEEIKIKAEEEVKAKAGKEAKKKDKEDKK